MTDTIAPPITVADPAEAARRWFTLLGRYCAAVDYDSNEAIFADDVVSFGTKATVVSGLGPLRKNQWEGIWGNIQDFRVDIGQLHAGGNADHAWGMVPWSSTGFHEDGTAYDRPGRATVILERRNGVWLSVHTHFSLAPGAPPRTYGKK
jgi:ketosteroid isomerase-like protein